MARLNPSKAQTNPHNQNLVERTKQRLSDILAALGQLPEQIGERLLVIQAKCRELFGEGISRNTLYKNDYKEIWAGNKQGEILENPTPPATMTQTVVLTESPPISDELKPEIENQQTQSVIELSHTPPLYEAFITEISVLSDLHPALVSQVPVLSDLSVSSYPSHENLSISLTDLPKLELELDLIQPELELKPESEQPFVHTTRGLRNEPLETVSTTKTHRSVVEIAREVRVNIGAVDDGLLLEFLHHPQSEAIELTIELADKLVAAQTADLVRAMVADLAQSQKIDLWRVLGVEEREAIEALMAPSASVSSAQAIPQSGGFCEGRRSANANDRQEPILTKGAVVRTLTGLIGVIQHVFQSVAKPFVVYHAEISRTICYAIDDLRFES